MFLQRSEVAKAFHLVSESTRSNVQTVFWATGSLGNGLEHDYAQMVALERFQGQGKSTRRRSCGGGNRVRRRFRRLLTDQLVEPWKPDYGTELRHKRAGQIDDRRA